MQYSILNTQCSFRKGFTPPPIFTNLLKGFCYFFSLDRSSLVNVNRKRLVGGFTALELLIVIAIMGVILATILPSFTNFRRSSLLNTESQELVSIINRARILSVSSKYDDQFGVHFEAGKVVLFQGDTYSPGATTNEEHVFNTALTLSPIVINGGGAELLFEKITGATSQNATTTLLVVGTTSSTTVLVLPTGIVTIF